MTARLYEHYKKVLRPKLEKEFGYKNQMEIPRLEKIVINMGVGRDAVVDRKAVDSAVKDLTAFKLREGMPIGCKVTLRRERMYEFLDRLVTMALPRVRDFRGISNKSFDGKGNYAMGLKEQIIFLEIDYDSVDKIRGLDIVFCTSAKTDKEAKALLAGFDMPFAKN